MDHVHVSLDRYLWSSRYPLLSWVLGIQLFKLPNISYCDVIAKDLAARKQLLAFSCVYLKLKVEISDLS